MIVSGEPTTCKCCGSQWYHSEGIYIENDEKDFFICGNCFVKSEKIIIDVISDEQNN